MELEHNPKVQPVQPAVICGGDTQYAVLLCQEGLWVRKGVIENGGKQCNSESQVETHRAAANCKKKFSRIENETIYF